MLTNTLAVILAGGEGARLKPLTDDRAKPAVPFGGKYRIIDFTLTNCLHSGLRRILVLTQYKSHSLQKHLRDGWSIFNPELREFITPVPPQMRTGKNWYQSTADAIFQNLYLIERSDAEYVIVLSADHIYRMDYAPLIEFHKEQQADLTVASMEVGIEEAMNFGILTINHVRRITDFVEKPQAPRPVAEGASHALASMGVYVFSTKALLDILKRDSELTDSTHDFGKDIIPAMIKTHKVCAYPFGGKQGRVSPDRYWRDVGTIDSYYEANFDLLKAVPPLDLYQEDWPIRTYSGQFPPARTAPGEIGNEGIFINSIMDSGSVISGGSVQNSILFHQVFVDDEASVQEAILFAGVHVGKRTRLRRCIVDKHVKIPDEEEIGYDLKKDRSRFFVSDKGIVVIPKGYRFS